MIHPQPKPTPRPRKARKPLSRKRAKPRRTSRLVDKEFLAYVRTLPCCAPHTIETAHGRHRSDPHHTVPRGRGGSDRDAIPLWRGCHRDVEALAGAFRGWTREELREWYAAQVQVVQTSYAVRKLLRASAALLVQGDKLEKQVHRARQELEALAGEVPS